MGSLADAGESAEPLSGWERSEDSGDCWEVASSSELQCTQCWERKNKSVKKGQPYVCGTGDTTLRLENGKEKEKKKDKSDLDEKQKKKLEK